MDDKEKMKFYPAVWQGKNQATSREEKNLPNGGIAPEIDPKVT